MTNSPWGIPLEAATAEELDQAEKTERILVCMRELTHTVESYTERNSERVKFLLLHLCFVARVYNNNVTSESDLKCVLQLMFDEGFRASKELKEWAEEVVKAEQERGSPK